MSDTDATDAAASYAYATSNTTTYTYSSTYASATNLLVASHSNTHRTGNPQTSVNS